MFSNRKAQIGRIFNIPTVCVAHPSGQWNLVINFISVFIFLHRMSEITNKRNKMFPLSVVADNMRKEMRLWQERYLFSQYIYGSSVKCVDAFRIVFNGRIEVTH